MPEWAGNFLRRLFGRSGRGEQTTTHECPVLVSSSVTDYCVTHHATDHNDGRAWTACRFRQLFYFENPMDEHTIQWADEIGTGA